MNYLLFLISFIYPPIGPIIINLPFILGDLFNTFDENWLNFINLNQILNLVFSFFYDNNTLRDLDNKINDYLKNFKKLYPNVKNNSKNALFDASDMSNGKFWPS